MTPLEAREIAIRAGALALATLLTCFRTPDAKTEGVIAVAIKMVKYIEKGV